MTAADRPVRATLICGFLGAGKTTFIQAQLHDRAGKTAVLVNEFGSLGLDGALLREMDGLQVVELAGGCICCSQSGSLPRAIREIIDRFRPERLLIEPSGVASASELIRVLEERLPRELLHLEAVVAVIDAETFAEYSQPEAFGTFFTDQLVAGDLIVVNKIDLVSDDQLQAIVDRLKEMNPAALIVPASYGGVTGPLPARGDRKSGGGERQDLAWQYLSLQPQGCFTRQRLEELASTIGSGTFGRILRAKGIVPGADGQVFQLQLAGGQVTIEQKESRLSPRLTCIGFDLDTAGLTTFLGASPIAGLARDIHHRS